MFFDFQPLNQGTKQTNKTNHFRAGVCNLFGKGLQPLLLAGSRTARDKVTISGTPKSRHYCVIFTVYVTYKRGRRLRKETWRATGWNPCLKYPSFFLAGLRKARSRTAGFLLQILTIGLPSTLRSQKLVTSYSSFTIRCRNHKQQQNNRQRYCFIQAYTLGSIILTLRIIRNNHSYRPNLTRNSSFIF
jgi:hypothetical protein